MKTLILIACLIGTAVSQYWGHPQQVPDTPEVAAAKAAHLAALAQAHQAEHQQPWQAQDRSWNEDDGSYKPELYEKEGNEADDRSWAPQAQSWSSQPQHWSPSQAHHAPQAHHAAQPHWESHEKKWTGPVALPPGYDKHGAPLPVLDTPEVAAEKSKHFHLYAHGAHAAAAAHSAPAHQHAAPSWHQ